MYLRFACFARWRFAAYCSGFDAQCCLIYPARQLLQRLLRPFLFLSNSERTFGTRHFEQAFSSSTESAPAWQLKMARHDLDFKSKTGKSRQNRITTKSDFGLARGILPISEVGADEETRTHTPLRAPAPQAGVSANSTTSALHGGWRSGIRTPISASKGHYPTVR